MSMVFSHIRRFEERRAYQSALSWNSKTLVFEFRDALSLNSKTLVSEFKDALKNIKKVTKSKK